MDIFEALDYMQWDLIILHPDCTKMAVCGNGTWAGTKEREDAEDWTISLWKYACYKCKRVCMENPVSTLATAMRETLGLCAKYIQPWQFGHPETKNTGLYLRNLPPLEGTDNVYDHMMTLPLKDRHKVWYASPGETRGKDRSRSYPGILTAMAAQWGAANHDGQNQS